MVKEELREAVALSRAAMDSPGLVAVQVCPAGEVQSKKGTFIMDATAAEACIAAFAKHGVSLPVDHEHESLSNRRAPAVGWLEHLWHDQQRGLMGHIRWNASTRDAIRRDEFRYLSPTLWVRAEDRRAVELDSIGLTHKPAIPRMERVAASQRSENDMARFVKNNDGDRREDPSVVMGEIAGMLGIEEAASDDDPGKLLRAIKDAVARLLQDNETNEAAGSSVVPNSVRGLLEWDGPATEAELLACTGRLATITDAAEMRDQIRARDVRDLLNQTREKGGFKPSKSSFEQQEWQKIIALAWRDIEAAKWVILERTRPIPPQGRTTPPKENVSARGTIIANATREFKDDPNAAKLTTLVAFVNDKLRLSDHLTLNDTERKALAV